MSEKMKWLPVGSVVRLKEGVKRLLIASRLPLFDNEGEIVYYDYGAYLYPEGQISEHMFYFNHDDIEEVIFEGFTDEEEEKFQEIMNENIENIPYPKFQVAESVEDE